jgi:hypothetical protein
MGLGQQQEDNMNFGDYIDPDNGRPICSRCASESGMRVCVDGEWKFELVPYSGDFYCWSCQQMLDEEEICDD